MLLTRDDFPACLERARQAFHANYLAMYSSVTGGIVTDPLLMLVPVDDHLVHRGDGVFEMFKCVEGGIYNLEAHLDRLQASAAMTDLALPPRALLVGIIKDTIRAAGVRDSAIRIYASRGPGSFGVNPYDCPQAQLYVVVTRLPPPFMTLHPEGASVKTSAIPMKPPFFATMKNCNYLPNVLMKKEAVEAGVDFTVTVDPHGHLGEGATENIGIVKAEGTLCCPRPDHVLCGTTLRRVLELAQALVKEGLLTQAGYGDITVADILGAREMLVFGTTADVTRVRCFEGTVFPEEGPVFQALSRLLQADIRTGKSHRTLLDR